MQPPESHTELTARTRMPLAFQPRIDGAPTPFATLLSRLIDIGGLGGVQEADEKDVESSTVSDAMRRLHTKVDLLLWMGAELLAIHRPLPASRSVTLYADKLRVELNGIESEGERQWLLLYCLEGLPMPLPLPVLVESDDDGMVCRLDTPDTTTQELYNQLLFRLHRREIAARRQS
ncbi:PilZ domain-containing protein [Algiphilus sp.]|nr:PilZ domain-containing protein [Algiphilus sp.]MBY8966992.1 PilZ domain-containing protein [Algiphilus acroporae]MCI5063123.1 PilZ domain-containing protein [Algiphilus sp.]MCI5103442.1 PilZ domain-containing protein [Algiphilus sp.]MCR9091691.1 PilZ domain-containing protein [Pseudomonadota bacterium]